MVPEKVGQLIPVRSGAGSDAMFLRIASTVVSKPRAPVGQRADDPSTPWVLFRGVFTTSSAIAWSVEVSRRFGKGHFRAINSDASGAAYRRHQAAQAASLSAHSLLRRQPTTLVSLNCRPFRPASPRTHSRLQYQSFRCCSRCIHPQSSQKPTAATNRVMAHLDPAESRQPTTLVSTGPLPPNNLVATLDSYGHGYTFLRGGVLRPQGAGYRVLAGFLGP